MKFLALIVFTTVAVAVSAQTDCTPLRCQLPVKPGDCTDSIPLYYFDNAAKLCKPFTYTGCGGNVNRFQTKALCESNCVKTGCSSPTTTTRATTTTRRPATTTTTKRTTTSATTAKPLPNRCTLRLSTGNCSSSIPRWYYDNASGQCKAFNYTGCGANGNNFGSKELCEQVCLAA